MYDILIVGAGPAGLAVAIEAKKKNLNHIIIDKGSALNSIVGFPKDMIFFSTSELLEIGGIPFTSNDIRPTRRDSHSVWRSTMIFELPLHPWSCV